MKIVFVSGSLNKHLLPICEELNKKSDFTFIVTTQYKNTEITLTKNSIEKDYILHTYLESERIGAENAILTADVAIFGGSSDYYLNLRKKTGKLCFIYSENLFKRSKLRRFIPSTRKTLKNRFIVDNQKTYVLCAGANVKGDLDLLHFDTNKCFKFGYFPVIYNGDKESVLNKKDCEVKKLLYVGRFLKLKRIKDIIKTCKFLQDRNISYELNLIGDGPEKDKLIKLSKRLNINANFLGVKSGEEVLNYMKNSNAMFFSSNHFEGWGAVVNEALSCGCPVIGSDEAGSIKYLIKDRYNGVIYKCGDLYNMAQKTYDFLCFDNFASIYSNSYDTVNGLWSAKNAVDRFLVVSQKLLNGETFYYDEGPLSRI